ncbi:hypothetical protein [Rhodomicrobium udaipurense]|uniref:Novel toxin 16 domain-containing protein n=1 Tax=Rhodomicrobium udaipurense TaxID=1202716 RepID=A0A8I1KKX7_9HYPH|nr:hypothetical protein [Rhodomicrobium udaipurense]MBJ7544736.1 hypothetical protein [Rhodomicrobium udaipurense]
MGPISGITAFASSSGRYGLEADNEEAFKRALERETDAPMPRRVAYQELSPPGDCTWAKHKELQNEVNLACKDGATPACEPNDSKKVVLEKIDKFSACVAARVKINATCFRGGDDGHKRQVETTNNGGQRCHDKLTRAEKREAKSSATDEMAAPSSNRSVWEKMEKATGLTGAALVAYLIVSEGSRVFPPRNAIPLP